MQCRPAWCDEVPAAPRRFGGAHVAHVRHAAAQRQRRWTQHLRRGALATRGSRRSSQPRWRNVAQPRGLPWALGRRRRSARAQRVAPGEWRRRRAGRYDASPAGCGRRQPQPSLLEGLECRPLEGVHQHTAASRLMRTERSLATQSVGQGARRGARPSVRTVLAFFVGGKTRPPSFGHEGSDARCRRQ